MQSEIPDKLYFKIGEVSKLAGVEPHVLRYWETEFKSIKPQRATSNQRMYKRDDVELILKIKRLLHDEGYTISGARNYLAAPEKERAKDPQTAPGNYQQFGSWLRLIKRELMQIQHRLKNSR